MLIAAVFLLLIITTVLAFVMKRRGSRWPMVWLMMAASGLGLWMVVLFVPQEQGVVLNWSNWFFSSGSRIGLYFQITKTNWGIIIALLAVHVAYLFTSGAEQDFKKDYVFWLVEAGEIALTFAVLASADLWSLILSWTALDACILAYELLICKNTRHEKLLHIYIAKVVGILLLMFNTALVSSRGGNLLLTAIPGSSSAFICLVAFLHSGVLPFYSFESNKLDHRSILDFFSFLLPFISSLFLITYLPGHQLSFFLGLVLKLCTLAGIFYFALLWINAPNEPVGLSRLAYAFCAFVVYCFLAKVQKGLQNWFVIMLLVSAWLLLHNRRGKSTNYFPIILLVFASGLPFSLANYRAGGILSDEAGIFGLAAIVFHAFFLIGFIRLIFRQKADFQELESSSQLTYLIGLSITLLSVFVITLHSITSLADEVTNVWAGIVVVLLTLGYYLQQRTKGKPILSSAKLEKNSFTRLSQILTFDWFFEYTDIVLNWLKPIVRGFSMLLEGEGGVLWSIVFLALLATLLKVG